jgi:hypothetical protein
VSSGRVQVDTSVTQRELGIGRPPALPDAIIIFVTNSTLDARAEFSKIRIASLAASDENSVYHTWDKVIPWRQKQAKCEAVPGESHTSKSCLEQTVSTANYCQIVRSSEMRQRRPVITLFWVVIGRRFLF